MQISITLAVRRASIAAKRFFPIAKRVLALPAALFIVSTPAGAPPLALSSGENQALLRFHNLALAPKPCRGFVAVSYRQTTWETSDVQKRTETDHCVTLDGSALDWFPAIRWRTIFRR